MFPYDSRIIIGIDLGPHKSVACAFRHNTGELVFRTIPTTPDDCSRGWGH